MWRKLKLRYKCWLYGICYVHGTQGNIYNNCEICNAMRSARRLIAPNATIQEWNKLFKILGEEGGIPSENPKKTATKV